MTAIWLPISTYWLSDDWLALHYASDLGRAFSDFAGNQYDLPGLVWFYRPLITVSFAIDFLVAGTDPLFSHLSNAVALGISTMLLGMLTCRFFSALAGWLAALVWATSPIQAGCVLWAVGRVDCHTIVWILLGALFVVRWADGRQRTRAPALLCCALALCSKELALVFPGIAAVLCCALATPGERLRRTALGSWPFFALLVPYFALRYALFDRFLGGYSATTLDPAAAAQGFAVWTARAVNPMQSLTADGLSPFDRLQVPTEVLRFWWVGFAPIAAAIAIGAARAPRVLLAIGALWLGCSIAAIHTWADTGNAENLRHFSLAFAALAALFGAAGAWVAVPALLVCVLPHIELREDYLATFADARARHERLVEVAERLPRGPVFVAGLPRTNPKHNVVEFHVGADRLLLPPFGRGHRVFALRPLSNLPSAYRLPWGDERGVPAGHTVMFSAATMLSMLPPPGLPTVTARLDGPAELTEQLLWDMHEGRANPAFAVDGPRASHYRVTVFTGGGYLSVVLPNEQPAGQPGGRISLLSWLTARTDNQAIALDIKVPTAIDSELRFPVLIEPGGISDTLAGPVFEATHAAADFVWVEFFRGYAEFGNPR